MAKKRKSSREKLQIIKEAEIEGVIVTCRKHNIDPATYYCWKEKYEDGGFKALKPQNINHIDPELKDLREENEQLKKIVAEKELAISMKEALLKKVLQRERRS